MASYLGGGLASLERWKGLKEWHQRHQHLLADPSTSLNQEGCSSQFQSSITDFTSENKGGVTKDASQTPEHSEMLDIFSLPTAKHDLSIIPEADEDSRSRDGDLEAIKSKQSIQKSWTVSQKSDPNRKTEENSTLPTKVSRRHSDSMKSSMQQNTSTNSQGVKRSFLRRGQGLVKYNLNPEDVKRPYRKGKKLATNTTEGLPKRNSFAVKRESLNKATVQSERNPAKQSRTTDLQFPMQRLVLSIPNQKGATVEIGTWSQVFGDLKHSTSAVAEKTLSYVSHDQQFSKQDVPKATAFQTESQRISNTMSPLRKKIMSRMDSPPEEDLESLAAYLDLEQHVGNASFCSTSSKVDRLVTKSSKATIHQSNPDAISQLKQLTPVKTGRKFFTKTKGGDSNVPPEDKLGMWSVTDLENLIKTRARRSGSLIKPSPELNQPNVIISHVPIIDCDSGKTIMNAEQTSSWKSSEDQIRTLPQEAQDIDMMLEALGPARKPHLMKTMSSIDLDSSLIKNALASTGAQEECVLDSESETESSSSETSFEEDLEEDLTSKLNGCANNVPLNKPVEVSQPSKDTVSCVPFKLVSDSTLEEINYQIESHLTDLRKEIETLQSAKDKTQKYITSLEKKVQALEHRLILDARSFNKRFEDERAAAAKRLSEEQEKCSKEKQILQRTLREERRKAPDPVTQQELLRLKQEIAHWEEKWRADRAKARGLESNLRIQLTNLKREIEKVKEENSKLRREKETAVSIAKAKASSNTRVINSIAQHLGNKKPKVTIVQEEKPKLKKQIVGYNLKAASQVKDSTPVATMDNFPKLTNTENHEWSTDEEIDLGKETSDEDDITNHGDVEIIKSKLQPPKTSANNLRAMEDGIQKLPTLEQESIGLQEAQAKYDAIFGVSDSVITPSINTAFEETNGLQNPTLPQGNPSSNSNNGENEKFVKSIHHSDGKVEQVKENGTRVITYPDGTWRRHSSSGNIMTIPPSGWPVQISYFNGDQLEKRSDGTTCYFYAKTNMWQTTHPDGHEELRYPSGQVERREPDGSVRVLLPGSTLKSNDKVSSSDGDASSNEVSVEKLPNGDTFILLPNGECELHTKDFMKKDFLDGTVKFLYRDGSQETRYPSGRIRMRDAQGNLVKDTSLT